MNRRSRWFLMLPLLGNMVVAHADCPSTTGRYTPATVAYTGDAANNVVVDTKTGLQWRRCAVGQVWSGSTCTASPNSYTHEGAFNEAKSRTGWRLPNVKELRSITDKGCNSPAIDGVAFPTETPLALTSFWSSSPDVGSNINAWYVDFYDGAARSDKRSKSFAVRLVRSSQ